MKVEQDIKTDIIHTLPSIPFVIFSNFGLAKVLKAFTILFACIVITGCGYKSFNSSEFENKPSYTGKKGHGEIITFQDQYKMYVDDAVYGFKAVGVCDSRKVIMAIGQKASYYHILGTTLVKTTTSSHPTTPKPLLAIGYCLMGLIAGMFLTAFDKSFGRGLFTFAYIILIIIALVAKANGAPGMPDSMYIWIFGVSTLIGIAIFYSMKLPHNTLA